MGTLRPEGALPEHPAFAFPILRSVHLSSSGVPRSVPQVSEVRSARLDAWGKAQVQVFVQGPTGTCQEHARF
ncbi:hypothetical protein MC885_000838 [Smutsia gigantea]|nr:hypothetical protein MC885_000838 [Smutsia gigantea]